jgi:hypothetical protein
VLSFSGTSRGVTVDLSSRYWAYSTPYVSRIMPLGDSITSGFDIEPQWGYRGPLWNLLTQVGTPADFLGNLQSGPSCRTGTTREWISRPPTLSCRWFRS